MVILRERDREGGRPILIIIRRRRTTTTTKMVRSGFYPSAFLNRILFFPFLSLLSPSLSSSFVLLRYKMLCKRYHKWPGLARLEDADVLDCISSSCCLSAFAYELNSADRIGSCFENQSKCQSRILFSFNKTRISGSFHSTNA